jgi:ADP-ribosylglycohydrolase
VTEKQIDIIKGVFWGQAIGDALGLGTEFLNKSEIAANYPNGLTDYSQIIQDKHRSRWQAGSWTDDTDQFLCICESIIQTKKVDELAFAQELFKWFKGSPMGIGKTVYKVVTVPQFVLYPHKASEIIWNLSKKQNASNDAIMRTSILGTFEFWDDEKVIQKTEKIARVTHWDQRCVGSCVMVTLLIANILNENKFLNVSELMAIGSKYDANIELYISSNLSPRIENLNLDETNAIGYTLKALSAGIWAYFHATDFEDGLLKVVNEGGDADTNACVAGSILGAKFGYSAIPQKYIDGLKNKEVLEKCFDDYLELLKNARMNKTFNNQMNKAIGM